MQNSLVSPGVAKAASTLWRDLTFVGFDTETTGKYPLEAEICEIAAVKWRGGQVVETFETLLKPSKPMSAEVIAIHNITNAMVENAPLITDKIGEFHAFIQDTVPLAHHAPFDLGFVSLEFEKAGLALPDHPVLCTSLLSRKLFPESENHRLQTLIKFFSLAQGAAHRALDDTKACLEVGLRCLEKTGGEAMLSDAFLHQGGALTWERFSMRALEASPILAKLITAIKEQRVIEMTYGGGAQAQPRKVHPHGLVRSLDGDFMIAYAEQDQRSKRFFLEKITKIEIIR
ncbi:MAG TPA: exonuclease domain-containing protein [Bdellovibrionales bacterium]|nr:exonuclease domain-containing protein [Bdellovibrionales bacterium]